MVRRKRPAFTVGDLPKTARQDIAAVLMTAGTTEQNAGLAVAAINQYARDYQVRARSFERRRDRLPHDRAWLKRVDAAAQALDKVLSERTIDKHGREAVTLRGGRADMVALHALSVRHAVAALRKDVTATIPDMRLPKGEAGDPALRYLEAAIADVLTQIDLPLKTTNTGALAQVLDLVHSAIGKPEADDRGRNNAARAIKNLKEWRALPSHVRALSA
jgi:hypothetical protein